MKPRLAFAAIALLACSGAGKPAVADRDWALVALGDQSDPAGTGGKPLTLHLDSAISRASGFAGCNQFSGSYQLGGGKLSFGPTMSTKMFCESSQQVEDAYLEALSGVSSWELSEGILTLRGDGGSVLRFR